MWGQGPCGSAKPVVALGGGVVRCVACSAALASLPACLRLLRVSGARPARAIVIQELQVSDTFGPVSNRGRHAYACPTFGWLICMADARAAPCQLKLRVPLPRLRFQRTESRPA